MNAMSMLDQLFKSGGSALGGIGGLGGLSRSSGGLGGLGDLARQVGLGGMLGQGGGGLGGDNHIGKYASGAAAGGLLGLLLGGKAGRGIGSAALRYGSVAAIGALAWRAYSEYQARQGGATAAAAPKTAAAATQFAAAYAPQAAETAPSFAALPPPQAEAHGRAMLQALIAGAKADGHFDDNERGLVEAELQRLNADPDTRNWVQDQLRRPVEPAEVAAAATSPEMAAEIYLTSLLVVDDKTTMERAYLDELARQLKLPPELKADLEARAAAG